MNHLCFESASRALRACIITPRGVQPSAAQNDRKEDSRRLASFLAKRHLRVCPELLPSIERATVTACRNLGLERHLVHAYVSPEVGRNAQCLVGQDKPVLIFGSELVTLLNEAELTSVVGHELGHFLLPELNVWSEDESIDSKILTRYGELTMDRVGLVACRDRMAALGAELKIHSGLGAPHLRIDISAAQHETREILSADGDRSQWRAAANSSHPPMPLRIRALEQFALSDAYLGLTGGAGGTKIAQINHYIQEELEGSIDHHSHDALKRHVLMFKAWLFCLCRIEGRPVELHLLNAAGPPTDHTQLDQAWSSLQHFASDEKRRHATLRLRNSLEKAREASPAMTSSTVKRIKDSDVFVNNLLTSIFQDE
jgi:hypothetical protein